MHQHQQIRLWDVLTRTSFAYWWDAAIPMSKSPL